MNLEHYIGTQLFAVLGLCTKLGFGKMRAFRLFTFAVEVALYDQFGLN
jgi:hypothetical protein